MKIAIRADAGPRIGGGHIMRCLTLAGALKRRSADVVFLCQAGTVETVPALGRSGYRVIEVVQGAADVTARLRRYWPAGADALIVDSYAIGEADERSFRSVCRRLVAIDDLAERSHDCDLLLDQNFGRRPSDYVGLVPEGCVVLAGTDFAMLRAEFAARRAASLKRRQDGARVGRVMVSLGLSDVADATLRIVRVVLASLADVTIDVVVGAAANAAALRHLAHTATNVHIHVDPPSMVDLMVAADLAIGAAGSTTWERCCLGLPTLVAILAENQRDTAHRLTEEGVVLSFDIGQDLEQTLSAQLKDLAESVDQRLAISRRAAEIVDGKGAGRVADAIFLSCAQSTERP